MEEMDVKFIEGAADVARELADQLYAAKSDDEKDSALARLNVVLTDIVSAAKGELPPIPEVLPQSLCCTQCAKKYPNNPPAYHDCMITCVHGC